MFATLTNRWNGASPRLAVALATVLITVAAVVAACLAIEIICPLLTVIPAAQVRLPTIATAVLVTPPIAFVLVRTIASVRAKAQALTAREELLFRAQHYAKISYWELDLAADRFVMSDAVHQLLGDPDKTLQVSLVGLIEMTDPADRDALEAFVAHVLTDGTEEELEFRIRGLDGEQRTVWVNGTRLLGADGAPSKLFGLYQDITERKAMVAALRQSEDYYRHAVELSPQLPWTADPEGNTFEVPRQWEALTGLTAEECLGLGWAKALHPDDLDAAKTAWAEPRKSGAPYSTEHRFRMVDGRYRWFRSRATARRGDDGRIIRWYGTVEDIHDRKAAEIALRESEAFASSILESTTDSVEVIDLQGRLQFMNKSGRKLMEDFGLTPAAGQDWTTLWPAEVQPQVLDSLAVARSGSAATFTCADPVATEGPRFWDISLLPILGPDGQPERLLCVSRDVTAQKVAQHELERAREAAQYAALHDSLTGLPNRPHFREHLERQLVTVDSQSQAALLFLDLDEFKSVNDSLGHPAGDQLLREAGARLRLCLRGNDLIARFAGDEFAVLQTQVKHSWHIESLAERIISCLSEPYLLEDREVAVGVSIGIAVADSPCVEADDLLKRADIALYQAKHSGRGVHRFFEPGMDHVAEERQQLRSELREALAKGEFRVHYQPVVAFSTLTVTSVEALLRWQHPRRGLLSPDDFMIHAEETNAIEDIGKWVLRQACTLAATWPSDISVSVNLSPRQFKARSLVEVVSEALCDSGLSPERLKLEITESLLLQDNDVVRETLAKLRDLGVRISIDDFGTGYSSLGYLRRFTVDNIKIDRSFVADLADNPRTAAILQAVVALGQQLGVSLTAEGIETAAQMTTLKTMGCCHGQGYLFSRPVPADEVPALLVLPDRWKDDLALGAQGLGSAPSLAIH